MNSLQAFFLLEYSSASAKLLFLCGPVKVVAKPRNLVYGMESVLQLAIIGERLPSLM